MRKTTQKEDKRQGIDKNENRDMIEAVAALAKEKNISKELLFSAIEEALKSAYKNNFSKEYGMPPSNANVRVELNRETGAVRLYARKTVERWPTDEATEISIEEAQAIQPSYQQDDIVEVEVTPDNFRRVAAQTAKQVIVQKIREAERGKVYDDFIEKENEILTAIVHSVDPETKDVYVELGKTEGVLEPSQQMATDVYVGSRRGSPSGASGREAWPAGQRVPYPSGSGQAPVRAGSAGNSERHCADQVHFPRGGKPHKDGCAFHRPDDRSGGFLRRPARPARGSRGDRTARREDRHHQVVG